MTTPASKPQVQFDQVSVDLSRIFNQKADIGVPDIISGWILDRRNVFDPDSRRRLKSEVLLVMSYLLLTAAGFAIFNLR